jgi:hypothetical protein
MGTAPIGSRLLLGTTRGRTALREGPRRDAAHALQVVVKVAAPLALSMATDCEKAPKPPFPQGARSGPAQGSDLPAYITEGWPVGRRAKPLGSSGNVAVHVTDAPAARPPAPGAAHSGRRVTAAPGGNMRAPRHLASGVAQNAAGRPVRLCASTTQHAPSAPLTENTAVVWPGQDVTRCATAQQVPPAHDSVLASARVTHGGGLLGVPLPPEPAAPRAAAAAAAGAPVAACGAAGPAPAPARDAAAVGAAGGANDGNAGMAGMAGIAGMGGTAGIAGARSTPSAPYIGAGATPEEAEAKARARAPGAAAAASRPSSSASAARAPRVRRGVARAIPGWRRADAATEGVCMVAGRRAARAAREGGGQRERSI